VRKVVVLGGYGRVGSACVSELLETTDCQVVIAGPSVQRAERAALSHGPRARGTYATAADPRAVEDALQDATAVVACASSPPLAALDRAIETRVPFVSLTSMRLGAASLATLGERAWEAETPVVMHAGAVPGLPGVAADWMLRQFEQVRGLRIATTGISGGATPLSLPALREMVQGADLRELASWRPPRRFRFPGGVRLVREMASADLAGFAEAHCVGSLRYYELDPGPVGAASARLFRWPPARTFTLVAEASLEGGGDASLVVRAESPFRAAAIVACAIVRGILEGTVPAGVLLPHEAVSPATLLDRLEKRGARTIKNGV
jgi:hypothetical protein